MAQYINKDTLVAKIKDMKGCKKSDWHFDEFDEGYKSALEDIFSFLDTLEVKETNSVWHDASELPDETSLILLSLKDGNFIVADEKTAYIRELVDKWCYISDI